VGDIDSLPGDSDDDDDDEKEDKEEEEEDEDVALERRQAELKRMADKKEDPIRPFIGDPDQLRRWEV